MTKPEIEKLIEEMRARAKETLESCRFNKIGLTNQASERLLSDQLCALDALQKCMEQRDNEINCGDDTEVFAKAYDSELSKILRGDPQLDHSSAKSTESKNDSDVDQEKL